MVSIKLESILTRDKMGSYTKLSALKIKRINILSQKYKYSINSYSKRLALSKSLRKKKLIRVNKTQKARVKYVKSSIPAISYSSTPKNWTIQKMTWH